MFVQTAAESNASDREFCQPRCYDGEGEVLPPARRGLREDAFLGRRQRHPGRLRPGA